MLGEGPLWHPLRSELFWFDIIGKKLFRRKGDDAQLWDFEEYVSAAGWIDEDHLLIASQSALLKFQISSGKTELVSLLEHGNPITRSNDGRADPWGGFWIGTMGIGGEQDAGSIYRYYRGELRKLFAPITISNAICFSPDREWGYFGDTAQAKIWRQSLGGKHGWPVGEPELFIDFSVAGLNPDGAICDAHGNLWNAQWGAGRVAKYSSEGQFLEAINLPTQHITCPAFGGENLSNLFMTSAREGLSPRQLETQKDAGKTFMARTQTTGQEEHRIVL